jgi:hypothetical protein
MLMCAAAGGGCGLERVISDSATRIAYAVRDGAARLKSSKSDTLVLSVAWRSWPRGCAGGYRVAWNADDDPVPGIGVECTSGRGSAGTTDSRRFVTVTRTFRVTKEKGEPLTVALRKRLDGAIEVVAVQ